MTATENNAANRRMIMKKVAEGMTLAAAIDAVLGAGRYEGIVSGVYEKLNEPQAPRARRLRNDR